MGLFGAWTLTSSTVSEAAINPGVDVSQIEVKAPTDPVLVGVGVDGGRPAPRGRPQRA
jgi:hypothetical protein